MEECTRPSAGNVSYENIQFDTYPVDCKCKAPEQFC